MSKSKRRGSSNLILRNKLKVTKHAKDISIHGASDKFKVGLSTVRQWMRQEKQLHKIAESSPGGKFKKRLPGGGRRLTFNDLDDQLAAWGRERKSKELRVSRRIVQQQAVRTFNSEKDTEDFKSVTHPPDQNTI
uniref:HTH psq-type domain-containing protein n=1 Tax=Ditylenchus dipsaci TaxID=166011 RepID=A0A915EKK7_9BILA